MTTDQLIDKKHITAITYFVQIDSTDIDEVTKCVKSYKPFVDRFIVIQNNDGKVYESIRQLADIYIVNKVIGFTLPWKGIHYFFVMQSDVFPLQVL